MGMGMGDECTAQAKEIANTTENAAEGTGETKAETAAESMAETAASEHPVPPAVAEYVERGWRMVPLRPGEKAPALARWPELRLDPAACARWFGWRTPDRGPDADEHNIGLILGTASGGLVDVDADAPEARAALVYFLPRTGRVSGRPGAPCSHFWYRIKGELPPTTRFEFSPAGDGAGAGAGAGRKTVLVELRSTGCQTMVAPSLHPSGERVRWEGRDEVGRVTAAELLKCVGKVAAGALLARYWPAAGSRDEAAKDLTGMLVRGGWSERETDSFVAIVAGLAGDEEWQRRGGKAAAAARKLAQGAHLTGGRSLAGRLRAASPAEGERVVAQLRAWLRLGAAAGEGAPGCRTPVGLGSAAVMCSAAPGANDTQRDAQDGDDAHAENVGILGEAEYLSVARLADLPEERLHWLWQGRIPLGALTVLDGDPGLGKSLVTLDLAARVTTGREMPDGTPGLAAGAGVLLLTSEDHLAATIRPRLAAAGADLERVVAEQMVHEFDQSKGRWRERPVSLAADVALLEATIASVGARLMVIDPLSAYLGAQVNTWRDQDVRVALAPVARMAQRAGVAVLIVRHLNKSVGTHAIYRGGGSIGIIGAARSGMLVGRHPDDPEHDRVLAPTKSNLGPPVPALRFRIVAEGEQSARVEWLGDCELKAGQLLALSYAEGGEGAAISSLEAAVAWLTSALAQGPRPSEEVQRAARGAGISRSTLQRARTQAGVIARKLGFGSDGQWTWQLPDDAVQPTTAPKVLMPVKDTLPPDMSTLTPGEDLNGGRVTQHDARAASAGGSRSGRAPALPDVAFPADGGLACDAVGGSLGMAVPAGGAATMADASDICPVTGGAHVYARMRDARGRPVCIECQAPQGREFLA